MTWIFDLLDASGRVLASSAGATAAEHVSASVQPNTTYFLRVKGFANGPSTFNIVCEQLLPNNSPNSNGGTRTSGSGGTTTTTTLTRMVRFTINPLTKTVTAKLLQ